MTIGVVVAQVIGQAVVGVIPWYVAIVVVLVLGGGAYAWYSRRIRRRFVVKGREKLEALLYPLQM